MRMRRLQSHHHSAAWSRLRGVASSAWFGSESTVTAVRRPAHGALDGRHVRRQPHRRSGAAIGGWKVDKWRRRWQWWPDFVCTKVGDVLEEVASVARREPRAVLPAHRDRDVAAALATEAALRTGSVRARPACAELTASGREGALSMGGDTRVEEHVEERTRLMRQRSPCRRSCSRQAGRRSSPRSIRLATTPSERRCEPG